MANNPKKMKDPTEAALSAIQDALSVRDPAPEQEAEQAAGGRHPSLRSSRSRWAMRDCSDHSSMNPGEACWENSPPDSAKVASWAS